MEIQYKIIFEITLRPFLEFLTFQKQESAIGNWMDRVEKVRLSVIVNPEQYLGKELPEPAVIKSIVTEIFDGYLRASLDIRDYKHIVAFRSNVLESGIEH